MDSTQTGARNGSGRLLSFRRAIIFAVVLPLALLFGWAGALYATGNLHAIVPGAAYRAAQLSDGQIADAVHKYGIRTVINLRGPNPGTEWFDREVAATRALGVQHIDFRMSAREELDEARLGELVRLLHTAQPPLLIHCEGGADRSALAAAAYRLSVEHASTEQASAELSAWYGHLPLLFPRTRAMDRSFDRLAASLPRIETVRND